MIIYDANNGLSLLSYYKRQKLWRLNKIKYYEDRIKIFLSFGIDKIYAEYYSQHTRSLGKEDIFYLVKSNNIDEYIKDKKNSLPPQFIEPPIIDERSLNPIIYRRILLDMGFECVNLSVHSYNYPKLAKILTHLKIGFLIMPTFMIIGSKRRVEI